MALSARRFADPVWVEAHLSPLQRMAVSHAHWYKATYFCVSTPLRRTVWALRNRGLSRYDPPLGVEVLTSFGEQVRRVIKKQYEGA